METSSATLQPNGLTAKESAALREQIARRGNVSVSQLSPQTNLIFHLKIGGPALGFLVAMLESNMEIKLLPTLKKLEIPFRKKDGDQLSAESRAELQQLVPGIDWQSTTAKTFDDIWTVELFEALVGQLLAAKPNRQPSESIWDWKQQDWLRDLPDQIGERKVRLLLAACCRYSFQPRSGLEKEVTAALEALERFADTGKTKTALRSAQKALEQWRLDKVPELKALHQSLNLSAPENALSIACSVMYHAHKISEGDALVRFKAYCHDMISPLQDPSEFLAEWRTANAVELAQEIYLGRNFSKLPQLAEVLTQAKCVHPLVLQHCQDKSALHVRGCWLIDAILDGHWPTPAAGARTKRTGQQKRQP